LQAGQTYEISVFNGNAYDGDQCAVWIDWNANGSFDEKPVLLTADETSHVFSGMISPPKGSDQTSVLMRIRLAGPGTMSAFGESQYGEVEDYSIMIASWLSLNPDEGLVTPGDSMTIDLKFKATDMETGVYTDLIKFVSNAIDQPFYNVPVEMNVTDLAVTAGVDPADICLGESAQLSVNPQGGTGNYTYSWTSLPEGFTSEEQNPVISPAEDTKYYVAVNDGIITMTDSAVVAVHALLVTDLGEDQALCGETQHFLDAGNPGATYLWSTGQTTQTVVVTGEGENQYWVEVTNENNCSDSDTINITFAAIPEVDLGVDTVICHDQTYTLDAGNAGDEYLWSTGETTQSIVVDATEYEYGIQSFDVVVTNQYACEGSDEVDIEIRDCTGIDENSQSVAVDLFPNPTSGIFKLELKSMGNLQLSIKVMSVSGVLVYEKEDVNINGQYSQQIDLTSLSSGVYSVFIIGDGFVVNKKIVLKR